MFSHEGRSPSQRSEICVQEDLMQSFSRVWSVAGFCILSATRTVQVQRKRRKRQESISKSAFRVKYLRRSRKLWYRYLSTRAWVNELYQSLLDISYGQKVVEFRAGPD